MLSVRARFPVTAMVFFIDVMKNEDGLVMWLLTEFPMLADTRW